MTLHPILLAVGILAQPAQPGVSGPEVVHVSNTFRFEVAAAVNRVAPLFGPEGERSWAGKDWNPEFLYPQPAKDVQGAVFQVRHGERMMVWVNTVFDLPNGRMQYVAFIDNVAVTTVDVRLTSEDAAHTAVDVTYTRTALQPAANDEVRALGESDRRKGPEWQKGVEAGLGLERR